MDKVTAKGEPVLPACVEGPVGAAVITALLAAVNIQKSLMQIVCNHLRSFSQFSI